MIEDEDDEQAYSRRGVLTAATALAGVGAAGHLTGRASAQTTGQSNVGSAANPALKVYNDVYHHTPLSSRPSSPDAGTECYVTNP